MSHSMDISNDYSDSANEIVAYASESASASTYANEAKHSKTKTKKKFAEICDKAKDFTETTLSETPEEFEDIAPEQACDTIYSLFIEDVFSTRYFHKVELKKVEEDIKISIYEVVMNWTEVKMIMDY